MKNKTTTSLQDSQHLIAGLLPGDSNIEFFGVEGKRTNWIQNGSTRTWRDLPPKEFAVCMNHFNSNLKARTALKGYKENGKLVSRNRLVEIYMYLGWGSADGKPDMIDGVLQPMENFRHQRECISLRFKDLKIDGKVLKPREVFMLDEMFEGHKNLVIAMKMKIAESTFAQHDAELKKKANVQSKPELMVEAWRQGFGQYFNRV